VNLVRGLRHDSSSEAGVVVALDTGLQHGLACVAEGLLTLDEWNQMQAWGCSGGQGPFIGPALPAEDVLPWLRQSGGHAHATGALGRRLDLRRAEPPAEPSQHGP
jgi:EAL domain-containing protein (putative c-di-GMP-specific phosphodiesterase class I)